MAPWKIAVWGHSSGNKGSWESGTRGAVDATLAACVACGYWVWDAGKHARNERCESTFGEKQAVQTRASGVHRRATSSDVILEGSKQSPEQAVLQAAGGQLGHGLQAMSSTGLLNKAALDQQGAVWTRAVRCRRIAARGAKAIKARARAQEIEAEAELQKALDGQEVAWRTWTSAEAQQCDEANLAECRTCQAADTVHEPSSGEDGGQGTGGEDEQFDAGWAAEEHQLQQLARLPSSSPGQEPEAAIAQDSAIAEAEEAETDNAGAECIRVLRKRHLR